MGTEFARQPTRFIHILKTGWIGFPRVFELLEKAGFALGVLDSATELLKMEIKKLDCLRIYSMCGR